MLSWLCRLPNRRHHPCSSHQPKLQVLRQSIQGPGYHRNRSLLLLRLLFHFRRKLQRRFENALKNQSSLHPLQLTLQPNLPPRLEPPRRKQSRRTQYSRAPANRKPSPPRNSLRNLPRPPQRSPNGNNGRVYSNSLKPGVEPIQQCIALLTEQCRETKE